jgi:hypothetical protein
MQVRDALEKYLPAEEILALSPYKLQASRLQGGLAVQAAQGMERSVIARSPTTYGNHKLSVDPRILNVSLTRAVDLFLCIADYDRLLQRTDAHTQLSNGQLLSNMRAIMERRISLRAFVLLLSVGPFEFAGSVRTCAAT